MEWHLDLEEYCQLDSDEEGHGTWADGAADHVGRQLTIQADKTAAVNPMKDLRIEKLVISAPDR